LIQAESHSAAVQKCTLPCVVGGVLIMLRTVMSAHLFAFVPLHETAADPVVGHHLPFGGSSNSGFATGASTGVWTNGNQLGLNGGNGAYLVQDAGVSDWWGAKYLKLNLLGKEFSYSIDLSNMGCGCVACVYLVAMGNPGPNTNYCDIQPGHGWAPCYELDIMEANSKAFHSSVHTHPGTAHDQSCNALGCSANIGRYPLTRSGLHTRDLYGPGASVIDTTHPFKVTARMDAQGHLETILSQGDSVLPLYNHSSAGNGFPQGWTPSWSTPASEYPAASGVPDYEVVQTVGAMQAGLVMAVTLWSGETHWLDTSACEGAPRCDMNTASFIASDLPIHDLSAATTVTSTMTTTPAPTVTLTKTTRFTSSSSSTGSAHPAITGVPQNTPTLKPGTIFWQNAFAPSAEDAKQAFQNSTGRQASLTVEAAASTSSVFSPNPMLVGLIAVLPILGCIMVAAQRRSYLRDWLHVQRGWLQVRSLDSDTCLIALE